MEQYLYGELNEKTENVKYKGGTTDTATVTINDQNTIYVDTIYNRHSLEEIIDGKIDALDYNDSAVLGKVVTAVNEQNGIISVVRRSLTTDDIAQLNTRLATDESNIAYNTNDIAILKNSSSTPGSVAYIVQQAIGNLDGTATAAPEADDRISVLTGITETGGRITGHTESILSAVAKTGDAEDVALESLVISAQNVEGALEEVYNKTVSDANKAKVYANPTDGGTYVAYQFTQDGRQVANVIVPKDTVIDPVDTKVVWNPDAAHQAGAYLKIVIDNESRTTTYVPLASNWSSGGSQDASRTGEVDFSVVNNSLRAQVRAASISTTELDADINTKLNSIGIPDEGKTIQQEIDDLEDRALADEGLIDALDIRVTANEGNITNHEGRVSSLESGMISIAQRLNTDEDNIDTLTEDTANLAGRMESAEGDITSVEGRVSVLELSSGSQEGDISQLQTDVGTLQHDLGTVEGDVSTLSNSIDSLSGRVTSAEGNIDSLQGQVSQAQQDISGLSGSVESISGTVETLSTDVSTAKSDISGLQTKVGASTDTAAANGTLYARIKQEIADRAAADSAEITNRGIAIGNAVDSLIGGASSAGNTLKKLEDRISSSSEKLELLSILDTTFAAKTMTLVGGTYITRYSTYRKEMTINGNVVTEIYYDGDNQLATVVTTFNANDGTFVEVVS